jgi:hypothetical protein
LAFLRSLATHASPAPPPGKIPADTVPDEFASFHVPDDFDLDDASNEEIRAQYQDWERRCRGWHATHELRPLSELLADPVAMADEPWDPSLI